MTTPSPIFTINGVDASLGSVPVASGGAIVALLQSTAGVQTTTWTLRATDELSLPAAYVLTPSGTVLQQCATTALTPGTCGVLEARINNGLSSVTSATDPAMTFRGKFYVSTAGGLEVGAAAEYDDAVAYASPTHGMIAWVNRAVRAGSIGFVPQNYGSAGSGVADSRAAIQAAIDAAGAVYTATSVGQVVDIPPGTYLLTSYAATIPAHVLGVLFRMRSGVTIRGAGIGRTVLKLGPGMNAAACQAALFCQLAWDVGGAACADNVRFEDFTWDGDSAHNIAGAYGYWGDAVHIETSTGVVIENVRAINITGSHVFAVGNGTYPHTCKSLTVTGCSATNLGNQLVGNEIQTDHSTIYGMAELLDVHDNHFVADVDEAGAALEHVWWTAIETHCKYGRVHDNEISNYMHAINVGAQLTTQVALEIDHNRGRNCYRGVSVWGATLPAVHALDGLDVHDNDFTQLWWADVPLVDVAGSITDSKPGDVRIADNRLRGQQAVGYVADGVAVAADQTVTSATGGFALGGHVNDGAMAVGSKTLTSVTGFGAIAPGTEIRVTGAGFGGIVLWSHVATVTTPNSIVLTDRALTAAVAVHVAWGDEEKSICVLDAGAGGTNHYTTIASVTTANSIEMTAAAVTSVNPAQVFWGDTCTGAAIMVGACDSLAVRGNRGLGTRGPLFSLAIPNIGWTIDACDVSENSAIDCAQCVGNFYDAGFKFVSFGTVGSFRFQNNHVVNTGAQWMRFGVLGTVLTRLSETINGNQFGNVGTWFSVNGYQPEPADIGLSWQSFTVVLTNDGGTVKHKIVTDAVNLSLPTFSNLVNGASTAFSATPQLAAGTGFTAGAGLSIATTSELSFDTPAQLSADLSMAATVYANDTADGVDIECVIRNENVNGVTRKRFAIQFFKTGTFTAWPLTAANIGAGETIYVHCQGYLRK